MKIKRSKTQLETADDIWNAVIDAINEDGATAANTISSEAFFAFQYYSEMESGGHESLLNAFQEYIEQQGFPVFWRQLINILEKIGAADYADIEKKYGGELGDLFLASVKAEEDEEAFYAIVEKADQAYHQLNGKIQTIMERYFVAIHRQLIDVVDD